MSKIFDISGNFKQSKGPRHPEVAFTGEIVLEDDKSVCGYCNDQTGKVWYLVGGYTDKEDKTVEGIEFYMLSNEPHLVPCLYVFPDILDGKGTRWESTYTCNGDYYFEPKGEAELALEGERHSYQEEVRIKSRFNEVELRVLMNNLIVETILENTQNVS